MSAIKANQVLNLDGDRIGSVVVDSIANMKNLNPEIEANATVELLGYYSKGDGGGGTFYWDSTSIEDDNGGTIIEATGVVDGRYIRNCSGAVNVKWFGAVGDGVTDDTVVIQQALEDAISQDRNLDFNSDKCYKITATLLIPQRPSSPKAYTSLKINGNNCRITTTGNVTVFESAYDNAGTLTSSAYTADDTYMSFGITLENFDIVGDGTATLPAIAVNSYHQGSKLLNINSKGYNYFLYAQCCYYMRVDSLLTAGNKVAGVARFFFNSNNNLMSFSNLVAVDANIGYKFSGLVDACNFNNNSIEGVDIGMEFTGEVRSMSIVNNYMENFSDVAINFDCPVHAALIDSNYINNTENAFVIDYLEGPNNKVTVGQSNSYVGVDDTNIIKGNKLIVGYNDISINQEPDYITDPNQMLVDNTKYSRGAVFKRSLLINGTHRAEKVNYLISGAFAGKYSRGFTGTNGFTFVNTSSTSLQINTKFLPSDTQRIYVNLYIYGGSFAGNIQGEFISYLGGSRFFEWTSSGYALSSKLNITTGVDGYIQINGTSTSTNITHAVGETRLI